MASPSLRLQFVTPETRVFDGPVLAVTLPGELGEMQVFAGHIPLLTHLTRGQLRIHHLDGRVQHYAVEEGFARVTFDDVCVLVDAARG
jgi:F-type H+-transporting ATPase subunit epsilon